jgi:hypothetical protein
MLCRLIYVRFEVFTVVNVSLVVLWVVTPCGFVRRNIGSRSHFSHEDGNGIFLRNSGISLQVHTAFATEQTIVDCCEHRDEPSNSVNDREFFD